MKTKEEDVVVYSTGLCYCSVCANKDLTIKEITNYLNLTHPTGISSKWKKSRKKFQSGQDNPCTCNQDNNRLHYLFIC